jgi:guanine deaminase
MHDEAFLREAIRMAARNVTAQSGGPFGAVVVRDGQIIGRGWNQVTSTNDPTAHAEIVAIRQACHHASSFWLPGCVVYSSCEPCPMCWAALYWARVACIHFAATREDAAAIGFADRDCYEELARPLESRSIGSRSGLREEAVAVMRAWSAGPLRIAY